MIWPSPPGACERVVNIPMEAFRPDATVPTQESDQVVNGLILHTQGYRHNTGNDELAWAPFYMEDWDISKAPEINIFWWTTLAAASVVVWKIGIHFFADGDTIASFVRGSQTQSINNGAGAVNRGTFPSPHQTGNPGAGSLITVIGLQRIKSDVADTLAGVAYVSAAGVTYQLV